MSAGIIGWQLGSQEGPKFDEQLNVSHQRSVITSKENGERQVNKGAVGDDALRLGNGRKALMDFMSGEVRRTETYSPSQ